MGKCDCEENVMVKELVHDPMFLAQKSESATLADAQVITDLLDTLRAHSDTVLEWQLT